METKVACLSLGGGGGLVPVESLVSLLSDEPASFEQAPRDNSKAKAGINRLRSIRDTDFNKVLLITVSRKIDASFENRL